MTSARTRLARAVLTLAPFAWASLPIAHAKSQPTPPPSDAIEAKTERTNLVRNGSFEEGQEPWFSFAERNPISWGGFEISDARARTGTKSARLLLDSTGNNRPTRIHGVIQEFKSEFAPERLTGFYLVDEWQRGTPKQYIQVVVILWGARDPSGTVRTANNLQVAYTLAGVQEPPLQIGNRRFILSGPKDPVIGEWIPFEFNPRADFKAQWGVDITNFEYVRVLYEVRYDDMAHEPPVPEAGPEAVPEAVPVAKDPGDASPPDPDAPPVPPVPETPSLPARAIIYYDDLYAGH